MIKAIFSPRSASLIYCDIAPVLYLKQDQEPGWRYSVSGFLPMDMGPVEIESTLPHISPDNYEHWIVACVMTYIPHSALTPTGNQSEIPYDITRNC